MKTLRFTYHMELRFSQPASGHSFTFRCFPKSDDCQKVTDRQVDIEPCDWTAEGVDSFGNDYIYGANESLHSRLYIGVAGNAQTGLADAVKAPAREDCGIFLTNNALTQPGEAILKLDRQLCGDKAGSGNPWTEESADPDFPMKVCHAVYSYMTYRPGVTHMGTTAEQACRDKEGVCQDYAHIMLALLRLHGIPCRYVAGILAGEGKSHAWVQAWQDGGWYGYDPTNDIRVTDSHISFAHGRNCMDTLVNRGVFRGGASQKMYVTATAMEVGFESYFS